jgi:hypothetical protein
MRGAGGRGWEACEERWACEIGSGDGVLQVLMTIVTGRRCTARLWDQACPGASGPD